MRNHLYKLAMAGGIAIAILLAGSGVDQDTRPDTDTAQNVTIVPVLVPAYTPIVVEVEKKDVDVVREYRVREVYYGMAGLASTEYPFTLPKLMKRWEQEPEFAWTLAGWFIEIADKYNLDPLDLAAITYRESRWDIDVEGDCSCSGGRGYSYHKVKKARSESACAEANGYWKCKSCGIMQANMGTRGSKWGMSCRQAKIDPYRLIDRGAAYLSSFRRDSGYLPIYKYNCPNCRETTEYEWRTRRTAELAHYHASVRMDLRSDLHAAHAWLTGVLP